METDELKGLEKSVVVFAERENLIIFKTDDLSWLWSYDEDLQKTKNTLVMNCHEGEAIEEFLKIAVALKAKVIYTDARKFTWNDLVERIDDLSGFENDEISKRKKLAEEFKKYDGLIEHLIVAFQSDGIWHTFQKTADWLSKYLSLLEEPEEVEEEEEEIYDLPEEDLEKLARKLALNSGFAKLKNKTDQLSLARKLFAVEDERIFAFLKDIVDRARVIYQTEVKE